MWDSGYLSIICTHLLWGMLPLYFVYTAPASAYEVVAARILFSVAVCSVVLSVLRGGWRDFWVIVRQRQLLAVLCAASLLIGCNWLLYVFATTSGHTLDASLGYFMNPLLSVLLGVIFLGERLRPLQWTAVGLAATAVLVMSVLYGHVPWIGLGLATSFGLYGLVKNKVGGRVTPLQSFTVESAALVPLAVVCMVLFAQTGSLTLFSHGVGHFLVLAASGVITAVPLLLFADAASKLPLSIVGMVQYVSPTIQFLVALLIFKETLVPIQLFGFIAVWVACFLFTFDAVRASRVSRRAQRHTSYSSESAEFAATGSLGIVTKKHIEEYRQQNISMEKII